MTAMNDFIAAWIFVFVFVYAYVLVITYLYELIAYIVKKITDRFRLN